MFGSAFKIARVWGIPIKVDWSLILLLVVLATATRSAGGQAFEIMFGLVFAASFFACIALHELGHAFVAIRKKCRVSEITLMFLGGVARMEQLPSRPMDELLMAIAGPIVSIVLGGLFLSLGLYLHSVAHPPPLVDMGLVAYFFMRLGIFNLWLAGFNLVPAFPMDGGRVLRASLSRRFGRLRATHIASTIGKTLAIGFGIYTAIAAFVAPPTGMELTTIILPLFLAFFIFVAARNEYRMVQMQEAARRQGFDREGAPWTPDDGRPVDDDDRVIISPPPYAKGPNQQSEIRPADDGNPFRKFFGR